mgnify:CR=1 FL=1
MSLRVGIDFGVAQPSSTVPGSLIAAIPQLKFIEAAPAEASLSEIIAAGRLLTLDLDADLHRRLPAAVLDLEVLEHEVPAHALAGAHRGDEAQAVEAVVEAGLGALDRWARLVGHARHQRHGQEAVRDGAAEAPGHGGPGNEQHAEPEIGSVGLTEKQAAERAVAEVRSLCQDLQIPGLTGLGIDPDKLMALAPTMSKDALASGSPGNNPRLPTVDEIVDLYRKAL